MRVKKVNPLEDNKKRRLQLEKYEVKGKEVLAMNKPTKQLNATKLEKLLLWHKSQKWRWETKKGRWKNRQKYKVQIHCHCYFNDGVLSLKINWKNFRKAKLN